jgi:PKD repeat protein
MTPKTIRMNRFIYLLLFTCFICACKKKEATQPTPTDFTISGDLLVWNALTFASNVTGTTVHYDFGDSTFSNADPVSHAYKKPGTYTVRLIVDNDTAHAVTKTISVVYKITFASKIAGTRLYGRVYHYRSTKRNIDSVSGKDVYITMNVISDSTVIMEPDWVDSMMPGKSQFTLYSQDQSTKKYISGGSVIPEWLSYYFEQNVIKIEFNHSSYEGHGSYDPIITVTYTQK